MRFELVLHFFSRIPFLDMISYKIMEEKISFHRHFKNTLDFADKLNDQTIEEDEIFVSYDVTSLFT